MDIEETGLPVWLTEKSLPGGQACFCAMKYN